MKNKIFVFLTCFFVLFSSLPSSVSATGTVPALALGSFSKILFNLVVTGGVTYEIGRVLGATGSSSDIMKQGASAVKTGKVSDLSLPEYTHDLSNVYSVSDLVRITGLTSADALAIEKEYQRYLRNPNTYAPDWGGGLSDAIGRMIARDGGRYVFTTTVSTSGEFGPFPGGYDHKNRGDYFRYATRNKETGVITYNTVGYPINAMNISYDSSWNAVLISGYLGTYLNDGSYWKESSSTNRWQVVNQSVLSLNDIHFYTTPPAFINALETWFTMNPTFERPTTGDTEEKVHDKTPFIPMPGTAEGYLANNKDVLSGSSEGSKDTVADGVLSGDVVGTGSLIDISGLLDSFDDVIGGIGVINKILNGIKTGIQTLVDFFTGFWDALIDFLSRVFIPSAGYFTSSFNNLNDEFNRKLGFVDYTELFNYVQGQSSLKPNFGGFINIDIWDKYIPKIHTYIKGFMFCMLFLYNLRMLIWLIRGSSPMKDAQTGDIGFSSDIRGRLR